MKEMAAPGITTLELETAAEKMISDAGANRRSKAITCRRPANV